MKETFTPIAKRKAFQLMKEVDCTGIEEVTNDNLRLSFKDGSSVDISNYGKVKWYRESN